LPTHVATEFATLFSADWTA
jgi:hypothetical protein